MADDLSQNSTEASSVGWEAQITDRFVRAVDRLRARTTQPLLTASRGVVFGLVVIICGLTVLILFSVGIFRLLNNVLPGGSWTAYLVLGGLCCALGAWFWSRRLPDSSPSQ